MVNLAEFVLKSDTGERTLFVSPVYLQDNKVPSLEGPTKAYVYEGLIKEDWWSAAGANKESVPVEFQKEMQPVIKYDQNFEQAYLGYLVFSVENDRWEGAENTLKLDSSELKELENLLNNYGDGKE
jgi:hypothetical protein